MAENKFTFAYCKWLWNTNTRTEPTENQYVQFIDYFTVNENEDSKVYLNISADSEYVVWINGKFAGYGQYADYSDYKVYDKLDISDLVYKNGDRNTLAVLNYHQGRNSFVYRRGLPGILYGITSNDNICLASSSNAICRTAPDYRSGTVELTTPQLSFVFEYDANKYDSWNAEGYVPSFEGECSFSNAFSYENDKDLYIRPIEKLVICDRAKTSIVSQGLFKLNENTQPKTTAGYMQYAYLSFLELEKLAQVAPLTKLPNDKGIRFSSQTNDDGIYVVLDMGREESGIFDFEIEAPQGTEIKIAYGEQLNDLRVRAYVGTRNFSGKFICSGNKDSFIHYIKRMGCRYIQLYVAANEFNLYYAGVRPTNYPVNYKGSFKCNDSLHNKIYDVCLRTLLLCMHEHYEDCPWREQSLYAMDSRNQMLCGYYAFGEYKFARESIRMLGLGQRKDGLLEICAPTTASITIPSFTLIWVTQLQEYVLYSGDISFAKEMWEHAEQIIRSFWMMSRGNDLLEPLYDTQYWNFYEWADGLSGDNSLSSLRDRNNKLNYDAPLNAFYYMALRSSVSLCKVLAENYKGESKFRDLEAWYEMLATGVKNAFNQTFWDGEKGVYCSYTVNGEKQHYAELTNALAIYAGLVPEDKKEKVANSLTVECGLVPITLSYSIFKYEALLNTSESYSKYVFDDITEKWGYMLYNNATTFWETIKGPWDFSNAGSMCHGWSAIPVIIYFKYVLGIMPVVAGFKDYSFKPFQTPILAAEGVIPSEKTNYHVSISPNGFKLNKEKL